MAVLLVAQSVQQSPSHTGATVRIDPSTTRLADGPAPSGADPAYPLNHTLDGKTADLGHVANSDFEKPSVPVGTPPSNSGFETSPADAPAVPNGDFETGDFTGWTTTGTPSIQTDPSRGYWARVPSGTLTTSALDVPSNAQALVYDVGYLTTNNYSWVDVYVLSGANFGTSTRVNRDYCFACGSWSTSFVNLTAYRGQTIKIEFAEFFGTVGLDNVGVKEVFPGWDVAGTFKRLDDGSGNHYAEVNNDGYLISPAFTVDASAQSLSLRLRGVGGGAQYHVYLATGPDFATWTQLAFANGPTSWTTVRFNVSSWQGQQVKVKVDPDVAGWMDVDDVGLQSIDIQDWDVTGLPSLVDDGTGNHYVSTTGQLTSKSFVLPSGVQNLSVRVRSEGSLSTFYLELLSGTDFSTVTDLLGYSSANSTWATKSAAVATFAGQTVKLRVRGYSGTLDVDDAGTFQSVLPGWTPETTGAVTTGEDANGTFATSPLTDGSIDLHSAWISPGIVDRPNVVDSRYYAISYDIGYSSGDLLQVFFTNDTGGSWTAYQDASDGPTGYKTAYFPIYDFMGPRGYFDVKLAGGGKVYSVGDNVARQQLSEPFSRKVGQGIDTTTGAFAFADTDVSIPEPLPLTFTQYYNAQSDRLGPLGYRWSETYDTHLELTSQGDAGVVFGSGREEFFAKQNDGSYQPVDPRIHSALVKNGDGTYAYTTKDNLTYRFGSAGVLASIEDLNGNTLSLSYDGSNRLSSITAPGGRTLSLAYDAHGRLSTLTDPDGAVYTYGYDSSGDLVSVTDPENGVRHYAYDRHRLTSVTDENGNAEVQNTYDDFDRVTAQTDALGKTISIAYDTPGKGATQVTDPEGGIATFYFDRWQRTTDAVDPSSRVTSYLYDGNGNLDKIIDPANNAWDLGFDASADLTSSTDPLGNPVSFAYSPKHLPTTITDARGNTTTFTYDAQGNLTSRTDPLGKTWTYTYDGRGDVLSETDPLNETTTYTYDAAGNRTSRTDPLGNTWTYTYDGANRLTSEADPLGNTTSYVYDLLGRLVLVRDPLHRETSYLYDPVGHLLMVEDPMGHQTTWAYDDRGLVESKTDAAGKSTTYGYDANRNMTSVTDPLGNTTTYGYDDAGRLTSVTDPADEATTYTYDSAGRLASKTDPLDRTTSYAYNSAEQLTGLTLPNNASISYGYDADGNLVSETDPLRHVTAHTYDADGRLSSTTDPLGNETDYGYDAAGRLTSVTDPLGHQTTYAYDGAGRQTSVADPLGHATSYGYDDAGRLTSVTDPTNRTTSYAYDAAGQLVSTTDPAGHSTTSAYNDAGWVTSVTLPSGAETTYEYDARGLLTGVTDPLLRTTSYSYDGDGRMASETDPMQHTTTYGYDAAGRNASITDAMGGVVGFGYDAAGQLTSVTDPRNKTWTYAYNTLGDRSSVTDPLGRTTTWGYDAGGEQTSRTDAREIQTTYGYDGAGQPTSVTYPGGSTSYGYDAAGNRTSMDDPTGTTTFGYDAANRVTSVGAPAGTLSYGYDAAGRRTSMTLPGDRTVSYGYDQAGRLSTLTDWGSRQVTFGYDQDGNRTSIERPNGVTSTYAYDAAGEITSIEHSKGPNTLLHFSYTYNADGDRTGVTTTGGTESYSYDALGRLIDATYPDGTTVSYTYDAAGNRTRATQGGSTTDYTYDAAGELTQAGSKSYSYDANGNVTQAGQDSYAWDFDNRLTHAEVGSHSADYSYDGDGVRVGSTVDGNSKSYLVDRAGGPPTVVDDGSSAYLHADGVVGSVGGSGPTYALNDALGSVRGLTDSSGSLVGTVSYDVFGAPRTQSGATSLFGFAGEPSDATGLTYLRARYLDPPTGRLLSGDSAQPNAAGTQGYNLYAYAANNPTNWTDPTGHTVAKLGPVQAALDEELDFAMWEAEMAQGGSLATEMVALQETASLTGATGGIAVMPVALAGIAFMAALLTCLADGGCYAAFVQALGIIRTNGSLTQGNQLECTAGSTVQVAVQNCPGIPQASGDPALRDGPPIPANPAQSPGPGWRWMPVGTSPGTDEGAWWNPRTNEYLHPHFRPSKHGPHWDYRDPDGKCWRIYPDGRWESKPC